MAGTNTTRKRKRPSNTVASDRTALSRPITTKSTRLSKTRPEKSHATECPICLEPTKPKQLVTLESCSCKYCKSCLNEVLTVGLSNITYPAQCCGRALELQGLEKYVDRKVIRAYRRKGEEMKAGLPVYCANALCGVFVGDGADSWTTDAGQSDREGKGKGNGNGNGNGSATHPFLTCGKCHMKTCARRTCKQLHKHHLGVHAICPGSLEDDGVRKLSEKNGWKRCPRCWALTEKTRGCDGIRCMCKAEWCYKCGKMQRGKDGCVCQVPGYVDLIGGERNRNRDAEDAELPSLAEIFGFDGRTGSVPATESVEGEEGYQGVFCRQA